MSEIPRKNQVFLCENFCSFPRQIQFNFVWTNLNFCLFNYLHKNSKNKVDKRVTSEYISKLFTLDLTFNKLLLLLHFQNYIMCDDEKLDFVQKFSISKCHVEAKIKLFWLFLSSLTLAVMCCNKIWMFEVPHQHIFLFTVMYNIIIMLSWINVVETE